MAEAKKDPAPAVSKLIVEGEPVSEGVFDAPDLGQKPDEDSPQPDPKAVVKLAQAKVADAADGAGMSVSAASDLVLASALEPIQCYENEMLSVYANPIAKQSFRSGDKNDKAGLGVGN